MSKQSYLRPMQPQTKQGFKTLVLDLDETLVHSTNFPIRKPDIHFKMKNGKFNPEIEIYVRIRPFVKEFLSMVSKHYEVVVFTASLRDYANPLLDKLDPNRFIDHRLFREHCRITNGVYTKDLSQLGRDMKNIIIIDNSPQSFLLNPENGILIKNFIYDLKDKELIRMIPLLVFLSRVDDIRDVNEWMDIFQNDQYIEYLDSNSCEKVVHKSQYLQEIIKYMHDTYFKKKIIKKRKPSGFQMKPLRKKSEAEESLELLTNEKIITDPSLELLLHEDFYLNKPLEDKIQIRSEEFDNLENTTASDLGNTTMLTEDSMVVESREMEEINPNRFQMNNKNHNSPLPPEKGGKKMFAFDEVSSVI